MPAPRVTSANQFHNVFAIDDSGSMSGIPAAAVNEAIANTVEQYRGISGEEKQYFRISILKYGSGSNIVAENESEKDIDEDSICTFQGNSGSTNMASALELAKTVLENNPGKKEDFVSWVFLLTDGYADDSTLTMQTADILKSIELPEGKPKLWTIGIGDDINADFLRSLASSPECFTHLKDPQEIIQKLPEIGTIVQKETDVNDDKVVDM